MDSAVYRVASVHTSVLKEAMRTVMEAYGNIVRILFWRTDNTTSRHHYFVEFDRPESVGRACRAQAQDVVVHALAAARPLCDVYKALVLGDDNANAGFFHPGFNQGMAREKERERELTRRNSNVSSPRSGPYDRPGPSNSRSNGYSNGNSTSNLPRRPSFANPSSSIGSSREHSATDLPPPSPMAPPTPKAPTQPFDTLMSALSSTAPPRATPLPLDTSIPITDTLPPLQQTISLSYNSIPITFDLTKLDNDPATIVTLLQQTKAERGLWAVVAGWYRRHGHAMSALGVLQALLDGVAQHSLPDRELRPIFFMLANCHRDLSHTTASTDRLKAQEHREHMRRWLHRALGSQTEEQTLGLPYSDSSKGLQATDSNWSIKAEYGSYKQGSSGDKLPSAISGLDYIKRDREHELELSREREEHERDLKLLHQAEAEVDTLRLKLREAERRRDVEMRRAQEEEERADRERRLRLDEREDAERLFSAISGIANKAANGGDLAALATGVVKLVR